MESEDNDFQKAMDVLKEALVESGGKVFAYYMVKHHGSAEQKSMLEAEDFLLQLVDGSLNNKDKTTLGMDYADMLVLARAINILRKAGERNEHSTS